MGAGGDATTPAAAVKKGELKFRLHGERLQGRFTIVRTSGRHGDDDERERWLLLHKRDEAAVAGWDAADHPTSVKSGRTNDEVQADAPARWDGRAPAAEAEIDLSAARAAPMPDFVEPMRATLATGPFSDPAWLYEVKWDGYRVEAVIRGRDVRLWTRNRQDAARYFPTLAEAGGWIEADEAIVDGEVIAVDEQGRPDFSLLQDVTGLRGLHGQGSHGDRPRATPRRSASRSRSSTRRSTCSTSTAARCSASRSRTGSACCARCSASTRWCATGRTS